MTIAVGVACPEGVVIAADSRSSVQLPNGHRVASDHANKVFELGRAVGATFGWGMLEGKTVASHVHDFTTQGAVPQDVTVAATGLGAYIGGRIHDHIDAGIDPPPAPGVEPLGFIVGGYDGAGVGHIIQVFPYGGSVMDLFQTNSPGGAWFGQVDILSRLMKGYDVLRLDTQKWAKRNRDALAAVEYISPFGWFTMQDAIDWSTFVVRTTIDAQRFTNGTVGTPGASVTCGGQIQVAAITPANGLAWIRRTPLTA